MTLWVGDIATFLNSTARVDSDPDDVDEEERITRHCESYRPLAAFTRGPLVDMTAAPPPPPTDTRTDDETTHDRVSAIADDDLADDQPLCVDAFTACPPSPPVLPYELTRPDPVFMHKISTSAATFQAWPFEIHLLDDIPFSHPQRLAGTKRFRQVEALINTLHAANRWYATTAPPLSVEATEQRARRCRSIGDIATLCVQSGLEFLAESPVARARRVTGYRTEFAMPSIDAACAIRSADRRVLDPALVAHVPYETLVYVETQFAFDANALRLRCIFIVPDEALPIPWCTKDPQLALSADFLLHQQTKFALPILFYTASLHPLDSTLPDPPATRK